MHTTTMVTRYILNLLVYHHLPKVQNRTLALIIYFFLSRVPLLDTFLVQIHQKAMEKKKSFIFHINQVKAYQSLIL